MPPTDTLGETLEVTSKDAKDGLIRASSRLEPGTYT